MNAQPNPNRAFGAPPPEPTGARRLAAPAKWAVGGIAVGVSLYVLQLVFPHDLKPSVVMGRMAGDTINSETETSRDIQIDFARRQADATAQANTKAQADFAAEQTALTQRAQDLGGMSTIAQGADWACVLSRVVSGVTQPHDTWMHQDDGIDWNQLARAVGASTCGLGNAVRQDNNRSLLEAVQETAAARGAPLTDGAVQVASAPPQRVASTSAAVPSRALPSTLAEVYAISAPSRHWPWPYVMKARAFIGTLPQPVQDHLLAGLDALPDEEGWSVLVDRVQAYQALPDAPLVETHG